MRGTRRTSTTGLASVEISLTKVRGLHYKAQQCSHPRFNNRLELFEYTPW